MAQKSPDVVLADSCRWVAYSAWGAAYRAAHDDKPAASDVQKRVEILVHDTDFIDLALRGNQWRNINRLLAAFAEAGTKGDSNVSAYYTHTFHLSPGEEPPEHPELWKGKLKLPAPTTDPSAEKRPAAMSDTPAHDTDRRDVYNELLVLAAKLDQTRRTDTKSVLTHDTAAMHAVRLAACILWDVVEAAAPPFPPKRTDHMVQLVRDWHDGALFPERSKGARETDDA